MDFHEITCLLKKKSMFDVGKEIDHGLWVNVCENGSSYEGEDDGFRIKSQFSIKVHQK